MKFHSKPRKPLSLPIEPHLKTFNYLLKIFKLFETYRLVVFGVSDHYSSSEPLVLTLLNRSWQETFSGLSFSLKQGTSDMVNLPAVGPFLRDRYVGNWESPPRAFFFYSQPPSIASPFYPLPSMS